jgi:hypothetical protein
MIRLAVEKIGIANWEGAFSQSQVKTEKLGKLSC